MNSRENKKRNEVISNLMEIKLRDSRKEGVKLRNKRNKLRKTIEEKLGQNSRLYRWVVRTIRTNGMVLRDKLKRKNAKKSEFLKGKYGKKVNPFDELTNVDKLKYCEAQIFDEKCTMKGVENEEPSIVVREGEGIILNGDEKSFLALGPKFCVFNNLNEEDFEREVEECIIKLRWELMGEEKKREERKKFGEEAWDAIEQIFCEEFCNEEELRQHRMEEQVEEARMRMIYNDDEKTFNFAKRRVTDVKGNARVILPKRVRDFELETKLETLRVELRGVFS